MEARERMLTEMEERVIGRSEQAETESFRLKGRLRFEHVPFTFIVACVYRYVGSHGRSHQQFEVSKRG
jgi:hypothetical protein